MKKTSRRTFGKQLTGALATLPVLSLGLEAQGNQRSKSADAIRIRTHDTPPPTEILDGSWRAHSAAKFTEYRDSARNRWNYDKTAYPYIVHVKVLHGSGEILYRNLNAKETITEIKIGLSGGAGDLVITGGRYSDDDGKPVFRIDSNKKLNYRDVTKGKRRHQYEHPGAGQDFRFDWIDILGAAGRLFFVKPPDGSPESEEYRLMIWHEVD